MPKSFPSSACVALHLLPGEVHAWPVMRRPGFLRGRPAVTARMRVLQGAVWVTWPGCIDDHFLIAGEELHLPDRPMGVLLEVAPCALPLPARVEFLTHEPLSSATGDANPT